MISKSLSTSRRYAALYAEVGPLAEFCQSLFTLLITHADDFGRLPGDVFTIKHLVFPISPRTLEEFNTALTALDHVGLIHRYHANANDYLEIERFEDHQTGLHKRTQSKLPDRLISPELPGTSGYPPELPAQLKGTELNLTEGKGTEEKRIFVVTPVIKEKQEQAQKHLSSAEADFERFRTAYPPSRRIGGKAGKNAFKTATTGRNGTHLAALFDALEQHKRSEQWQTLKLIPLMTTWLNQERWNQTLPESKSLTTEHHAWCQHIPKCNSPKWHDVVLARERGDA